MEFHSWVADYESAHVSRESGQTDNVELELPVLPPCSSNDWENEVVPAPTPFVRRPSSKSRPAAHEPCDKEKLESCKFNPNAILDAREEICPLLVSFTSTHGMQSKHYAAHRRHVGKELSASDATQDECGYSDGWDIALDVLS